MANLPQQNTIVQYVADGVTTNYSTFFYTPLEADGTPDLDVYTQAQDATPVPLDDLNVWNVDYTYSPNPDPTTGGTVVFNSGHIPPNGYIVTIVRNVSASLDVEFSEAQNFSGITLDAALDKLLLITQQNKSYANDRNLSYIVNSYLPDLSSNVQIPVLQPGYIWIGATAGGVTSALLQQGADTSTLRSELANNSPGTDGALLVGYYDSVNNNATTVDAQLTLLTQTAEAAVPTGTILDFGGTSAPVGFLLCDGQAVSRTTYDDLFAVINTIWGSGDGSTTFNVPNLNGRVTAGSGGTLPPLANSVGSTGGAATYTLLVANLPQHTHGFTYQVPSPTHQGTSSGNQINAGNLDTLISAATDGGSGTSTAFTIVQPTAIVLKIIKT